MTYPLSDAPRHPDGRKKRDSCDLEAARILAVLACAALAVRYVVAPVVSGWRRARVHGLGR